MTYRGHQVLQTLIRCHFSPAETTGSQYLYSGSSDGRIHVSNLAHFGAFKHIVSTYRYGLLMVELSKYLIGRNLSLCPWTRLVLNHEGPAVYTIESVCEMLVGTLR
jgi:hypothetical protein